MNKHVFWAVIGTVVISGVVSEKIGKFTWDVFDSFFVRR
jgi:hypothetical protein